MDFVVTMPEMCKVPANAHLLRLQQQGETISPLDIMVIWWHTQQKNKDSKWYTYLQASQYFERFMPTLFDPKLVGECVGCRFARTVDQRY